MIELVSSDQFFQAAELNRLEVGEFTLRMPTLHDIAQIRIPKREGSSIAQLHVDVSDHRIHVTREDGQPLQVEVNPALGQRGDVRPVFSEAVEAVVFHRARNRREYPIKSGRIFRRRRLSESIQEGWLARPTTGVVTNAEFAAELAQTIGHFGTKKQSDLKAQAYTQGLRAAGLPTL